MNGSRAWFEKDFYKVLGVGEGATADEIKRAFKKLARVHHPDRNPGDTVAENKMKDASEAYDVLSDDAKRQEYDQMRRLARSGYVGGDPGQGWRTTVRMDDIPFDLGDLFGGAFGGGGRSRARSADVEARARVSFEDAIAGATIPIQVDGREFKVKVPAAVNDGARIRVRGRGRSGGDLYVVVEVAPHPVFGRHGKDLTVTVPVSFPDAVLGGRVTAPTLDGSVTITIPEGTQTGRTFRARGKGFAGGDLLVTVEVAVPTGLSDEERDLIERFRVLREKEER